MKQFISSLIMVTVFMMLFACNETESPVMPEPASAAIETTDFDLQKVLRTIEAGNRNQSMVIDAGTGQAVGVAKLKRVNGKIKMKLKTSNLYPGHAFTIWWVIFNNPNYCTTDTCGPTDLFVPDVQADILYAAGRVSNRNGYAVFKAKLEEGDMSGTIAPLFGMTPVGLLDANGAEVHLVVRSHGPVIPGQKAEQLTTYGGGCQTEIYPPDVPNAVGECGDIQFSIHQP